MTRATFFDGRRAVPHAVTVAPWGDGISIRDETGEVAVSWRREAIARVPGTRPDGGVVLTCGEARLVVFDPALLGSIAPARGYRRPWRAGIAAVLGLAAVLFAIEQVPRVLAPLVPWAIEDRIGGVAEAGLMADGGCHGAEGLAALLGLERRLSVAAGLDGPVRLVVADDLAVNAFALPGRRIVVLRGLIARAADADELAGVLAHETAHLAHRDPVRLLIAGSGLGALARLLSGGTVTTTATTLTGLAYGRAAEAAADASALEYLRAAGLRADGLGRFLGHMEEGGLSFPAFLSDHPSTAGRQAALAGAGDGATALGDADWAAVRAVCAR